MKCVMDLLAKLVTELGFELDNGVRKTTDKTWIWCDRRRRRLVNYSMKSYQV